MVDIFKFLFCLMAEYDMGGDFREIEDFYLLCKDLFPKNLTQILYQEVLWFPERVSQESFEKMSSFTEEELEEIKKQLGNIVVDKIVRVQSEKF